MRGGSVRRRTTVRAGLATGPFAAVAVHYTRATGTRGERSTGAATGGPMDTPEPAMPADRSPARWGGMTVALIGPDGAGKSTIARSVIDHLPFDATTVYMGINLEASTTMLPTTRLLMTLKRRRGRRADMTLAPERGDRRMGPLSRLRRLVRVSNWIAEEAYRVILIRRIRRRGAIAVLDRDFYCDYYWNAVAPSDEHRPIDVRLHGAFLRRWYPRPDLALLLDAPPEVLMRRRPEHDLPGVVARRDGYLALADVLPAFAVVPADRPLPDVVDDIARRIVAFVESGATSVDVTAVTSTAPALAPAPASVPIPTPIPNPVPTDFSEQAHA